MVVKSIAVVGNRLKSGACASLDEIVRWAEARGAHVQANLDCRTSEALGHDTAFDGRTAAELTEQFRSADLGITLGGDGTLLFGAQVFAPLGVPVLSANLGSLGFHTQVMPHEMIAALDNFCAGGTRIERRLMLSVTLLSPGENTESATAPPTMLALNDVVISKSDWGRMVHLTVSRDGQPLTDLSADALIVATPTGSSAYNYAAHGPVLEPSLDAMLLNAICPHRMNFAPVVVPGTTTFEIEFQNRRPAEEAHIVVDGQPWLTGAPGDTLKISRADVYLPLIVHDENFFVKLREKLSWGTLS